MQPYFQALSSQFEALHAQVRAALAGLPPEALDWQPGPEINSASVLVTHLTGAERFWIGDVVMGETSHRNREAEFVARGRTAADLENRLQAAEQYLRGAFERLALADLEAERISPRNQQAYLVGWCLNHALEHTALHLGHLEILRQLWEQRVDRG
jgi:hypothetical protein